MRQYTNEIQTAKLIELGFEKPKGWYVNGVTNHIKLYVNIDANPMMFNYSIGELISFLPTHIHSSGDTAVLTISYDSCDGKWYCGHRWHYSGRWRFCGKGYNWVISDTELVDAIYRYIVELKEEGKI